MDIVTIDFETYYDKEYSLSKMTTEAYVRGPRFEVIGVGIKINDYPVDWYSGSDPGRFLRQLDYSKMAILCHNTVFDGAILSWHFGIRPKLWLDTLSMARPLHNISVGGSLKALAAHYKLGEKGDEVVNAIAKRRADFAPSELERYAAYCCNDVDLTYKLFRKMARNFPAVEIALIDQTIRMFTEPSIVLDPRVLAKHLQEVKTKKASLVGELGLSDDYTEEQAKSMLMSNQLFANYLTALGVTPPTKISAATGKETFAFSKTDKRFTDLLEHDDARVVNAVAARMGVKSTLEETRTESLRGVAERGTLPIMLNYYGAHTGRFCVVGNTEIIVLRQNTVLYIPITDLLPDDLVWDGLEFVTHGGLADQGEREVMTYGGITGTPDHRVFCDEVSEAVELRIAAERNYTLTVADPPTHRRT